MTRSKRLRPIARLAADRERQAARELAATLQEFDARLERLHELGAYREEYARRFKAASEQGLDAGRLRDFRSFLSRLDEAIVQQERLVAAARREWEACTVRWQGTRSRTRMLDKVMERLRREEERVARRREQGESDERAQRRTEPPTDR